MQVLWWKCATFLMSFSKPQVSFPSNFVWLFSVVKANSSALFWTNVIYYFHKRDQSKCKCSRLECLDQNPPNSCHFWNNKSVFLQILRHSSVSWDITSLYFFSWNSIYFQLKEPIKVQIWWNFTWAVESLKFCTLMGFFCRNHTKFQPKKYRRVISHDTEYWCKV